MIKNKFTKKSVVISMGGGVLGDVSALAASLYYRGLIYFNIPTTMTSIIDSCVGGKTAINYKNIPENGKLFLRISDEIGYIKSSVGGYQSFRYVICVEKK